MNKKRRKTLMSIVMTLEECSSVIDSVCCEEQDSLENTPENLMYSERYSKMEEAADSLEEAVEQIDYAIEHIEIACGGA